MPELVSVRQLVLLAGWVLVHRVCHVSAIVEVQGHIPAAAAKAPTDGVAHAVNLKLSSDNPKSGSEAASAINRAMQRIASVRGSSKDQKLSTEGASPGGWRKVLDNLRRPSKASSNPPNPTAKSTKPWFQSILRPKPPKVETPPPQVAQSHPKPSRPWWMLRQKVGQKKSDASPVQKKPDLPPQRGSAPPGETKSTESWSFFRLRKPQGSNTRDPISSAQLPQTPQTSRKPSQVSKDAKNAIPPGGVPNSADAGPSKPSGLLKMNSAPAQLSFSKTKNFFQSFNQKEKPKGGVEDKGEVSQPASRNDPVTQKDTPRKTKQWFGFLKSDSSHPAKTPPAPRTTYNLSPKSNNLGRLDVPQTKPKPMNKLMKAISRFIRNRELVRALKIRFKLRNHLGVSATVVGFGKLDETAQLRQLSEEMEKLLTSEHWDPRTTRAWVVALEYIFHSEDKHVKPLALESVAQFGLLDLMNKARNEDKEAIPLIQRLQETLLARLRTNKESIYSDLKHYPWFSQLVDPQKGFNFKESEKFMKQISADAKLSPMLDRLRHPSTSTKEHGDIVKALGKQARSDVNQPARTSTQVAAIGMLIYMKKFQVVNKERAAELSVVKKSEHWIPESPQWKVSTTVSDYSQRQLLDLLKPDEKGEYPLSKPLMELVQTALKPETQAKA